MKLVEAKSTIVRVIGKSGQVVLVHGHWGIGKSYLIEESLKEYSFEANSRKWIKVSVFNAADLPDFRDRVGISRFLKTPKSENRYAILRPFTGLISLIPRIGNIVRLFVEKFTHVSYYTLSDAIIWIDDLERCGNPALIVKILGEVNDLVENKNCSCIIACHSEAIETDSDIKSAVEKSITHSLHFERDRNEILAIGLGGHTYSELFSQIASKLDIHNIRIIRRINEAIHEIRVAIGSIKPEVMTQIEVACAIGCYVKFSSQAPVKLFSYLNTFGLIYNPDDYESIEYKFLSGLGFTETDDLDRLIFKYIDTGLIDIKALVAQIKEKSDKETFVATRNEMQKLVISLYTDLGTTNSQIVSKIMDFARAHSESLIAKQCDDLLRALKVVGSSSDISEFLNIIPSEFLIKIEGRAARAWGESTPSLCEEIQLRVRLVEIDQDDSTLSRILGRLIDGEGWWSEDYARLANFSPSELENYLHSQECLNGARVIKKLLALGYDNDFKEEKMRIQKNTLDAVELVRISQKGTLALSILKEDVERAARHQESTSL